MPPGTSASFAIRPRRNKRIGPPHGRCNEYNPFDPAEFHDYPFRRISCQKMCLQRHIIIECGCYDVGLPPPTSIQQDDVVRWDELLPCQYGRDFPDECMTEVNETCVDFLLDQYDRIECARNVTETVSNNERLMADCNCNPPCQEIIYDVSYSLSKWPARGLEGNMVWRDIFTEERFLERFNHSDEERRRFSAYFASENWDDAAMNDFARINVYMADSSMIQTEESPDYDLTQLISDVGGQLGVWVGMSVVTLSETFALFGELIRYAFARLLVGQNRRQTRTLHAET